MNTKIASFLAILLLFSNCSKKELKTENEKVYVPKLAKILVKSDSLKIYPWKSLQLTATGYDSLNNEFPISKIQWGSMDSTRISVNQSGTITTNLLGLTKVRAVSGGITGSVDLEVYIKNNYLVGKNILLDSIGSSAETSVAFNPKNPLNIAASANWVNFCSFNGGRTWKRVDNGNSGLAQGDPNVCFLADGTLLRQGLGLDSPRGVVVQRSNDGGLTLPVSQVYWAYKPATDMGNADQGIMCSDTIQTSKYFNSVYVITSDYPAKAPSYAQRGFSLIVLVSRDGGKNWLKPVDISSCSDCGQEHSSYITTGPNGEVYAAWWNLKNQIVFNKSLDGGVTWGAESVVRTMATRANPYLLTDDVRGNITIAVDNGKGIYRGKIYLSGMDQNGASGGAADAWMVNSSNGGNSWSNTVFMSDGNKGPYKYYFQPRISVAPNGRVDAVWYDTRNWTGTNINSVDYDLYYAYSTNGGQSFSPNIRVSDKSATKTTKCTSNVPCGDRQLYEYIGLTSDNQRVMPVWATVFKGQVTPAFATIWMK